MIANSSKQRAWIVISTKKRNPVRSFYQPPARSGETGQLNIYGTDTVGNIYNWLPYNRRVNKDGNAKLHFDLQGDTVEERTASFLKRYWRDFDTWDKLSKEIGIKTEFAVCLARSETSIGGAKKSSHNYFNCGNNDRGDTIHFSNLEKAFRWLGKLCLNGTYLRNKTTLSHLYPNHKESTCKTHPHDPACAYSFATSKENAFNNVANCLGNIHQNTINSEWLFRL